MACAAFIRGDRADDEREGKGCKGWGEGIAEAAQEAKQSRYVEQLREDQQDQNQTSGRMRRGAQISDQPDADRSGGDAEQRTLRLRDRGKAVGTPDHGKQNDRAKCGGDQQNSASDLRGESRRRNRSGGDPYKDQEPAAADIFGSYALPQELNAETDHERKVDKQPGSPVQNRSRERQQRAHRDGSQHHGHAGSREGAEGDEISSQLPQPARRSQLQQDTDLDHKRKPAEEEEKQPGIRTQERAKPDQTEGDTARGDRETVQKVADHPLSAPYA